MQDHTQNNLHKNALFQVKLSSTPQIADKLMGAKNELINLTFFLSHFPGSSELFSLIVLNFPQKSLSTLCLAFRFISNFLSLTQPPHPSSFKPLTLNMPSVRSLKQFRALMTIELLASISSNDVILELRRDVTSPLIGRILAAADLTPSMERCIIRRHFVICVNWTEEPRIREHTLRPHQSLLHTKTFQSSLCAKCTTCDVQLFHFCRETAVKLKQSFLGGHKF